MASIRTAGMTRDFGDLRAVNEIDSPSRRLDDEREACASSVGMSIDRP